MASSSLQTASSLERGAIAYSVVTTRIGIAQVADAWANLLRSSQCNRAFSSSAWYLAALACNPELSPYLIVARRSGKIEGLFPLAWDASAKAAIFPSDLSDYNDLIAATGDDEMSSGLLAYARGQFVPGYRLILSCLRPDSACGRAFRLLDPTFHMEIALSERCTCPHIRLRDGYASWLTTQSQRFRHNLKYTRRQAEKNDLLIGRLDPQSYPAEQVAEVFLSLQVERFGDGSLFVKRTRAQAFVRHVLPRLLAEKSAIVFAIRLRDKIIGMDVCMLGADSLCVWNGGFNAEASRWSPGWLLLDESIREACAMQLGEFDLLRGSETYKSRWANGFREIGQLTWPLESGPE